MNVRLTMFGTVAVVVMAGTSAATPAAAQAVMHTLPGQASPRLEIKPSGTWSARPQLKPIGASAAIDPSDEPYAPAMAATVGQAAGETFTAAARSMPVALGVPNTSNTLTASQQASAAVAISDFSGRYLGSGAEVALANGSEKVAQRMSQVEITGSASEFTLRWATVKLGPNFKPLPVKATEQKLTFRPGPQQNQFVAVAQEPGEPAPDAKAWIEGRTLVVLKTERNEQGIPSVQRYERTLTDGGMDVLFTRTENGVVVRKVTLTLAKGPGTLW